MKTSTHSILTSAIFPALLLSSNLSDAAVYTEGHGDLGVAYENGELHLHFHAEAAIVDGMDVGDQEYDPSDIVIQGASTSLTILQMDHPGLGKSVGDSIWVLPWTEVTGLPFLGLASEELNASQWGGGITFQLTGVTSPSGSGHFALWRYDIFSEMMLDMSSLRGPSGVTTQTGGHDHFNFGFTEPGEWEITLTASGNHVTDGFKSDTETFRFHIIPEPASATLAALGAVGILIRRRR